MSRAILEPWIADLGTLFAQITLLVLLIWAIARLLVNSRPALRYLLWLVVTIRLCLPIPFSSPIGLLPAPIDSMPRSAAGAPASSVVSSLAAAPLAAVEPVARASISPRAILGRAWLAIVSVLALALVGRCAVIRKRLRATLPLTRPDVLERLGELGSTLGLRRVPELKLAAPDTHLPAPAVFGIFRPVILIPERLSEEWDLEDIEPVLIHELVHVKRLDPLVNLLQMTLQIVYFFHPLVWVVNAELRHERELACDDEVVRMQRGRSRRYVRAMLRLADSRFATPRNLAFLAMVNRSSRAARRVRRLLTVRSEVPSGRVWRSLATVFVLALGCAAVGVVAAQKTPEPVLAGSIDYVETPGQRSYVPAVPLPRITVALADLGPEEGGVVALEARIGERGRAASVEFVGITPRRPAPYVAAVERADFHFLPAGSVVVVRFDSGRHTIGRLELPAAWRSPAPMHPARDYVLAGGQKVHLVFPPFGSERSALYETLMPAQAKVRPEGPSRLTFVWDGRTKTLDLKSASFGPATLRSLLRTVGWSEFDLESAPGQLDMPVHADLVMRRGATREELLEDLARELRDRLGAPVHFDLVHRKREILVATAGTTRRSPAAMPIRIGRAGEGVDGFRASGTDQCLETLASYVGMPITRELEEPLPAIDCWYGPRPMRTEDRERVLADFSRESSIRLTRETRGATLVRVAPDNS